MNFNLIVKPEAEEEIEAAAIWYENRRQGLGSDFLMAIEASFAAIKRNPEHFLFIYKNVQRALMKRFPYVIYFIGEEQTVFVLAVVHEKRSPKHHLSRVGNP